MKRLLLPLLIFTLSACDYSPSISPEELLKTAHTQAQQGDTISALVSYSQALELSDSLTSVAVIAIEGYTSLGYLELAADLNNAMILKYPDSVRFYFKRAVINVSLGQPENIDKDFERYFDVYPKNIKELNNAAYILFYARDFENGILYTERAMMVDSDDLDALYLGANIYNAKSNIKKADSLISHAMKLSESLDTKDCSYFTTQAGTRLIADIKFNLGDFPECISAVDKLLDTIKDEPYLFSIKAYALLNLGCYSQAEITVKEGLKIAPNDPDLKSYLKHIKEYENLPAFTIVDPSKKGSKSLMLAQSKDGKYGYVTYHPQSKEYDSVVVPFKYENGHPNRVFQGGFAAVSNGKKWAVVSSEKGDLITGIEYDNVWIEELNKTYIVVKKGSKYGFVTKKGQVGEVKYDNIGLEDFPTKDTDILIPVMLNKKCGFVDIYGKVRVPLEYDDVTYFGYYGSHARGNKTGSGHQYRISKSGAATVLRLVDLIEMNVGWDWVFYEYKND